MIKKLLFIFLVVAVFFSSLIFSKSPDRIIRNDVGKVISITNQNGLMETKFSYYKNGYLKEKIQIKEGEYHGKLKSWYPNGTKEMEIDFKDGTLSGTAVVWFKNGKIKMLNEFLNGDHHGKSIEMTENGELSSMTIFKNGEISSSFIQKGKPLFKEVAKK